VREQFVGRAVLSGGQTSKSPLGLPARTAIGLSCVAALTRAACRSNVGLWPGGARLSGGRTFELWVWSNSPGKGMRIQVARTAA